MPPGTSSPTSVPVPVREELLEVLVCGYVVVHLIGPVMSLGTLFTRGAQQYCALSSGRSRKTSSG